MTPLIEPGIKPLVSAINRFDYAGTVYSCEGHFNRPQNEKFLPTAYVTFGVSDVGRFARLHQEILSQNHLEAEADYRLTYDCFLGRYTLSIWPEPNRRGPAQKRAAVDSAVERLSAMILACAERPSPGLADETVTGGDSLHPCGEPVPPCTLVIPLKEPACPFAGLDATGKRKA